MDNVSACFVLRNIDMCSFTYCIINCIQAHSNTTQISADHICICFAACFARNKLNKTVNILIWSNLYFFTISELSN